MLAGVPAYILARVPKIDRHFMKQTKEEVFNDSSSPLTKLLSGYPYKFLHPCSFLMYGVGKRS